ncbi:DEAD/DEAH box helicase family protein [Rhodopseudomonas palustris]|uniref:DEAD/DEAH box helicase family protein n=1 Tax=Rhodopseudomonas palustris TaxID=1076 RepID=UPI0021F34928|nr:DEAD/DEAH box helicase family protein [Rhodopseudomonas palustris]UYO54619.1 hypothetical protein KQX61_04130 [Rhodopseudomonas palustris]
MLTKLENEYEAALQQLATIRNKEITQFDREVSRSIFCAGLLAIEDRQTDTAQYRVVSAPTGSGKSSYAQAFIRAYVKTFPDASVLFLVETIQQAEDTFRSMSTLVGDEMVAVWTGAHDIGPAAKTAQQEQGIVPQRCFAVDDLKQYPIVIATHAFYMGSRAHMATFYRGEPRKLTFVDERAADVAIFDVDTGLIKTVRDRLAEQYGSEAKQVTQLTDLHDHLEAVWRNAKGKNAFDVLPRGEAVDLNWFRSSEAISHITSSDGQIGYVFGFGRALAKGYAFLSRYDECGNGARFVGYETRMPLTPGTILLDATADIDGVSLVVNNRRPVWVPKVDYCNLSITHIEPPLPKGKNVSAVIKQAKFARPYAEWIMECIEQNTQPGEQVLVVVHKALLEHEYLPNGYRDFTAPLDLNGREVCFSHWGTGIGSNRWKDAGVVFLFGEFHIPKRAMVATMLGLNRKPATAPALSPYQCPNPKVGGLKLLREGNLCRWMKQLAMRGNARNIDGDGRSGRQRLYVTGEFERLIEHKDRMFPGATLSSQGLRADHGQRGVKALVSFLYSTDVQEIGIDELQALIGVSLRKNRGRYLSNAIVSKAMQETGFAFQGARGRGNSGRLVRTGPQALAA